MKKPVENAAAAFPPGMSPGERNPAAVSRYDIGSEGAVATVPNFPAMSAIEQIAAELAERNKEIREIEDEQAHKLVDGSDARLAEPKLPDWRLDPRWAPTEPGAS